MRLLAKPTAHSLKMDRLWIWLPAAETLAARPPQSTRYLKGPDHVEYPGGGLNPVRQMRLQ